jgi:c-di-GMP-binding flagellar brake protein YcgR
MRERRKYERFDLKLPATIEVQTSKGKETFDFVISNISSEGCFIHIYEPFPEGTEVRLKVIVTSESLRELTGAQGLIKVGGRVVRSNFIGMGICFDEEFQLLTLPNLVPE